jgi:amino acid adenylation domain-containing protein/thioester reductase-like protein
MTKPTGQDFKKVDGFWKSSPQDARYPSLPSKSHTTRILRKTLGLSGVDATGVSLASVIRATWAIVLARYCDTDRITFGATLSTKMTPSHGPGGLVTKPTITVTPTHIRVDKNELASKFLSLVEQGTAEMADLQRHNLQNMHKLGVDPGNVHELAGRIIIPSPKRMQPSFAPKNDVLVFESANDVDHDELVRGFYNYPLVTGPAKHKEQTVDVQFHYSTKVMRESQVEALAQQYEAAFYDLVSNASTKRVADVAMTTARDLETAYRTNTAALRSVGGCVQSSIFKNDAKPDVLSLPSSIAGANSPAALASWSVELAKECLQLPHTMPQPYWHSSFEARARTNPDALAISAWDGSFTYDELNRAANRLGHHLVNELAVKQGDLMIVNFEKSVWYFVAILAVNKVGAAWVALDPVDPPQRQEQMVQQTRAKLALTSEQRLEQMTAFGLKAIEIGTDLDEKLSRDGVLKDQNLSIDIPPESMACVAYISSGTGFPRGVVVSHQALFTSQLSMGCKLGLTDEVRILQFSLFTFELSMGEFIAPLMFGASIHVPSEEVRFKDLMGYIRREKVSWAFLNASFAETLWAQDFPDLRLLLIAGEPASERLIYEWFGRVRLISGWGSAETCGYSSFHEYRSPKDEPNTLGFPVGDLRWIVDRNDPHKLAPIGVTGEVVVQGPTLMSGYLNEDEDTKRCLLSPLPEWAPLQSTPGFDKMYKTGDLALYNPDGTIRFVARNDMRVKFRGMRMEIGDIEHHMKLVLPEVSHLVVDLLKTATRTSLVVFIRFNGDTQRDDTSETVIRPIPPTFKPRLTAVMQPLKAALPAFMIPSLFVSCDSIPMDASSKPDRRMLHDALLKVGGLEKFHLRQAVKSPPQTKLQHQIRKIWGEVLKKPEDAIDMDDDFYRIGGDSILVIFLSKKIEQQVGVKLQGDMIRSNHMTIRKICTFIEAGDSGSTSHLTRVDLFAEIDSFYDKVKAHWSDPIMAEPNTSLPDQATVFLTGGAGYLGSEMLRQLLCIEKVQTVVVLIRASTVDAGLQRVKRTAELMKWWDDKYASRIEVWLGDLAKTRMGLNNSQWDRVFGKSQTEPNLDAFVQNGAVVNWNASYEQLKGPNVQSTLDMLAASVSSPRKPKFIFISGGAKMDKEFDKQMVVDHMSSAVGYSQTKFVAERVVYKVACELPEHQNRISVVKPGRIIGTPEHGVVNLDDLLWRVVATAAALGTYPSDPQDVWMFSADVGTITGLVINNLVTKDGVDPFDSMDLGISVTEFWDLTFEELGVSAKPVPWDEWVSLASAQADKVGSTHPIWAVQGFLGSVGWPSKGVREPTEEQSKTLNTALRSNVRYLAHTGLIDMCKGEKKKLEGETIRRTGAAIK